MRSDVPELTLHGSSATYGLADEAHQSFFRGAQRVYRVCLQVFPLHLVRFAPLGWVVSCMSAPGLWAEQA